VTGWLQWFFHAGGEAATAARWVVVDCETSGLDSHRDTLISIAGVGVLRQRISPRDCFDAMIRQQQPSSRENILVHGIGRERQAQGEALAAAIAAFLDFAEACPRVAYRAPFDRAVLARAAARRQRARIGAWLDLAQLLPVLFPQRGAPATTLDTWLAGFGIAHPARHEALGDAYATAQLFQIALAEASRQGFESVAAVFRAARAARWSGG
jgi:DNA polymerase III subunit epsilon